MFPRIAAEIDHLEALKQLAQRRLGVTVVPAWSARYEIERGLLAPLRLGPTGLARAWGVLHPDLQPCPATLRALAEALPPLLKQAAA